MTRRGVDGNWRARLAGHLAEAQHRNAYFLMLNNVLGAATGFLFWLVLARLAGLPAEEIGVGYAVVALGTVVGTIAKGGLDTALLRNVPGAGREEGARLLRIGALIGSCVALLVATGLGAVSTLSHAFPRLGAVRWALVGLIASLLVLTWLQDAYFLARGDARSSFHRNVVLSAARLLLPVPLVGLAFPHPVAGAWALALAGSALGAAWFGRHPVSHGGRLVPRLEFLRSAARNVTGSAAEFLPGLLLVPLVLALDGPDEAAFFAMAWTAASTLFLASAAISRSALAELVRRPSPMEASRAIRRAARQHLWTVLPAILLGALLAPWLLLPFGVAYGREGAGPLAILCASAVLVAPTYLYMAVLRAAERPAPLLAFPIAMLVALGALAPVLDARFGTAGVAAAWLVAHVPLAAFATWRLRLLARTPLGVPAPRPAAALPTVEGVTSPGPSPVVGGDPHPE